MKILAFSDLHYSQPRADDLVAASAQADLVIGAGDFCNMRQDILGAMALLRGITTPMVVVPGNAESEAELSGATQENTIVLHGSGIEIGGLRLFGLGYGIPPTPFGDWSCDMTEDRATELLEICDNADILILHSPPKGVADLTSTGLSIGSVAIFDAIERIQPKLALCGHIHDSWGKTGQVGRTNVVNLGPTVNWFDL